MRWVNVDCGMAEKSLCYLIKMEPFACVVRVESMQYTLPVCLAAGHRFRLAVDLENQRQAVKAGHDRDRSSTGFDCWEAPPFRLLASTLRLEHHVNTWPFYGHRHGMHLVTLA